MYYELMIVDFRDPSYTGYLYFITAGKQNIKIKLNVIWIGVTVETIGVLNSQLDQPSGCTYRHSNICASLHVLVF